MLSKMASVCFDLLLRLGFDHFAQPKAHPVQHLGHGAGRGQLLLSIALGSESRQRPVGGEPRIGQRGAKRRVLLCMGFGQLPQGGCGLWMRVFPTFTAAEGGLGAPRQMIPVRLSANPPQWYAVPNRKGVPLKRALPPQYFTVISASKARRVGPLIWDAAKRKSAICDALSGC